MEWEYLGEQKLQMGSHKWAGHYTALMWRTSVPGGWLIITTIGGMPPATSTQSFYPDPDHVWTGGVPQESDYLLRPASAERPQLEK